MRFCFCPEIVTDDYGYEVPCAQPAEMWDVRVVKSTSGPVTMCRTRCLLGHPHNMLLEDVCEMPD